MAYHGGPNQIRGGGKKSNKSPVAPHTKLKIREQNPPPGIGSPLGLTAPVAQKEKGGLKMAKHNC